MGIELTIVGLMILSLLVSATRRQWRFVLEPTLLLTVGVPDALPLSGNLAASRSARATH